ncbi:MAG: DUF1643 domain-containing protein [Croceivirga sp.]
MDFSAASGAIFNDDKSNRYILWRKWDSRLPNLLFIGLNPSKADGASDDPTTLRLSAHTKRFGHGGFYLLNCFTHIATNPRNLRASGNWQVNLNYVNKIAPLCETVVFVWGKHTLVQQLGRDQYFQKRFPRAKCFGSNVDGSPKHPLYLPYKTALKDFATQKSQFL